MLLACFNICFYALFLVYQIEGRESASCEDSVCREMRVSDGMTDVVSVPSASLVGSNESIGEL